MGEPRKQRRTRRPFTAELKADAARLGRVGDRSMAQVAANLEIVQASLHRWGRMTDIDACQGPPRALRTDEREELARLRRKVRRF